MIKGYLRYRRTMLCAALAACATFTAFMLLLRTDTNTIIYANMLYVFVIGVFVVFDLFRYKEKVARLADIKDSLTHTAHDYPESENNIEKLYSDIISSLYGLMDRERGEIIKEYSEQVDYYTMWLHQIKNPIAAMRLAIEGDSTADPVYEQELFKIERYVEMALQYVKLKNPENDLVLECVDIDPVIRESIKKYKTMFIYKRLGADFKETGQTRITDKKWLAFIVEQILSNAVKYTERGGISIYAVDSGFAIEDSGIGIRAEDIERIFEKGYTGFNGRLNDRASGLGLYMASTVAKSLGIELSVSSRPGKGTVMSVLFK